jgi:FlaG/FlaF family flagellin (archaellin)
MRIKMMFIKNKGVSTFIAVLLLMALAVAAGVVIYSYTMGYLGGMGGSSLPGTLSLDTATCLESTGTMTAYVRNIGKGSISFDAVYVDGVNATFTATPDPLQPEDVAIVTVTYPFTAPTTYEIKLVGKDNTQLTFNVKTK